MTRVSELAHLGLVGSMHGLWISILQFSALSQATENEGYVVMGPGRGAEGQKEIQGLARTWLGTYIPAEASPAVPGAQGFLTFFGQNQHLLRVTLCLCCWQLVPSVLSRRSQAASLPQQEKEATEKLVTCPRRKKTFLKNLPLYMYFPI